jgi:hypothetical protein
MNSAPTPKRQGRRLALLGALIMVLGVVIAATAAVPIVRAFSHSFIDEQTSPVYTAPLDEFVQLRQGKYLLLESQDASAQVSPDAVQVNDITGAAVTDVRQSAGHEMVERNGERFVDVIEFTAPQAGRYRVDVISPPQARLIIGQDPADILRGVFGWVGVGGVGGLILVLGVVLLLIGLFRGRPAGRAQVLVYFGQPPLPFAQPSWPPPPGWYPDPRRPGGWRYWDGYRWQP